MGISQAYHPFRITVWMAARCPCRTCPRCMPTFQALPIKRTALYQPAFPRMRLPLEICQAWRYITTCIRVQGPPMMGEHGPMPPSHFGQMGGPGPFGGGRGRGFGRGGPGDGFRSDSYRAQYHRLLKIVIWMRLGKALYCDPPPQKR